MANRLSGIQTFRADINAILDAMAAEYAERVVQFRKAIFSSSIATINQETVSLDQT